MKQRWTLHVEDFGPIKSADVEIAPMMLFVGPNNTGKSYLASLLWGILESEDVLFPDTIPSDPVYEKCRNIFISHFEQKKAIIENDLICSVIDWVNRVLKTERENITKRIFTYDDLNIGSMSIQNFSHAKQFDVEWRKRPEIPPVISEKVEFSNILTGGLYKIIFHYGEFQGFDEITIYNNIKYIAQILLKGDSIAPIRFSSYLPASRTGFMLSYQELAASLMEHWGLRRGVQAQFPLPIIRFLQKLIRTQMSEDKDGYSEISSALENSILNGQIVQAPKPMTGFYYVPDSTKQMLPLHITSSLVTELAPLIIFLKEQSLGSLIVFEEPESHLHLNAQRILAKYLVKLVNNGLPVWMTTHSDIFFQQINNLIATNEKRVKKLKELSYQDDEMIQPEDIRAYQFNIGPDGRTDVIRLEQTEDGIIAPTFNQAIWNLSEETLKLEADSDDAE